MKLTFLLFFVALFQVSAISYAQQTRLNLKFENETLESVFSKIEQNSEFSIFYKNELLQNSTQKSGEFKDAQIFEVLDEVLNGEDLTYSVTGKLIILLPDDSNNPLSGQQNKKVDGSVTNTQGKPIPGVTVIIKGTTEGTVTDADGRYSIPNVPDDATLVFSFIGMKTQEIIVSGKTSVSVTLAVESIGLEEVVAIGYGSVKKSDLTGAVGSVQGEAIAERQGTQVSQALQGAMAGVMVTRDNNAPGSTATIRIRGITTIGDNNPLIIVDGVPVENINDINPNDIQDISVLKDAASASIYGSRAAAGVILVTTKRAKTNELSLEYSANYGIESPTKIPEFVDAVRYMQIVNELRWNDNGNNENEYPLYSKDLIDNYGSLNTENPDLYPIVDWVDLILKKNAPRQSHTLSVSAGTKSIRSKLTVAYDKTDALYDGRTYERITSRFNNDVTINKFLSATLDIYYKRSINNNTSMSPMYNMLITPPIYAALLSDGRVGPGKAGANIYANIEHGGFRRNWDNQVSGKISIDITPFDGLKISAIMSPSSGSSKAKNFYKEVPFFEWDNPNPVGLVNGSSTTRLWESRNDEYQVTTQLLANYSKLFGKHTINLLGGYENYYAFYEDLTASREQYDLNSFPYLDLGPLTFRGNGGSAFENAYRSWFGRIMYNYQNKYFLQANIRYDSSSRFHRDYRLGSFPSFSAGWVMSQESFMEDISVLSFLKLRGSWGSLGNERIGNYPYQSSIAFNNALFFQGSNVVSNQSASQTKYAIRDISWEKTETFDVGIDAGLFDNKLRFTVDYYNKTTKDMLLSLEIPDYIGFDNPDQNTGEMNTKGWEFETSYNNRTGDLDYSVSVNVSDFKSIMGDLGGTEFLGSQIKIEGSEFNEWYGYQSEGLFQTQDEVNTSAKLSASVKPGDVKYKDISGPEGIPDGKITPEYDRILLGGSLPRYMYGGNLRLNYKGFDFSIVVQGVGKQNSRLGGLMVRPLQENWGNIPKILDENYWSVYNTPEENLNSKYPQMTYLNDDNYLMSDYWLINGGYFRLKNLTLGYSLPQSVTKKVDIQKMRIYMSMSDLFTIDRFPKGWDPEVSTSGYPITSSLIFGVSVKF